MNRWLWASGLFIGAIAIPLLLIRAWELSQHARLLAIRITSTGVLFRLFERYGTPPDSFTSFVHLNWIGVVMVILVLASISFCVSGRI
ncbi:MAG TPA: hypothetical protein VFA60_07550 [Terriglobales bacterium]|nr:hypothetical protein [Terriglobales bacterium]